MTPQTTRGSRCRSCPREQTPGIELRESTDALQLAVALNDLCPQAVRGYDHLVEILQPQPIAELIFVQCLSRSTGEPMTDGCRGQVELLGLEIDKRNAAWMEVQVGLAACWDKFEPVRVADSIRSVCSGYTRV